MDPGELPEFFAPLRPIIVRVHEAWQQRGQSALGGCLAFALQQPEIDAVIVGVNSIKEFEQIEAVVAALTDSDADTAPAESVDPAFLDPSQWPEFVH